MMNKYFYLAIATLLLMGCGYFGHKPTIHDNVDSSQAVCIDSSLLPSPNVDNLFNDFIYEFMNNPTFQLTRIQFPIHFNNQEFTMQTWHHDSIFANHSYYVVLCSTPHEIELEKSVELDKASVFWLYANKQEILHYTFERNSQNQWLLTSLGQEPITQLDKGNFHTFYQKFVEDTVFQQKHVAKYVKYSYFNEDTQQTELGFITGTQWSKQKPELPEGDIAAIHYGQSELEGKYRYLMLRGLSNGLTTTITFEQRDTTWYVVGVDN